MQPELIPNQNSFGTQVGSEQLVVQQQRVLRNTYLLLALSLIPTGIGALIGVNLNFGFMRASPSSLMPTGNPGNNHRLRMRSGITADTPNAGADDGPYASRWNCARSTL